jgi:hypothetical protein
VINNVIELSSETKERPRSCSGLVDAATIRPQSA